MRKIKVYQNLAQGCPPPTLFDIVMDSSFEDWVEVVLMSKLGILPSLGSRLLVTMLVSEQRGQKAQGVIVPIKDSSDYGRTG